ncbi:MAG TPA: glycosyltransferase family 2 protein [Cellvibrionaceae bacterium]
MLNLCVVIPVYNHPDKIRTTVATINAAQLPVLMVDDGSEAQCAQVLDTLASSFERVFLLRHSSNCGKGAAVMSGLNWAYKQGYSHVLQIDADGQHNLADIPQFIAAAEKHPDQVISGDRIYINAPKSRMRARKLTDIWVWINTLSLQIKDSMCGYRVYPLQKVMPVLQRYHIGKRMSFDTDILVKMVWSGCKVTHIPTKVVYAADIPSHFHIVKDNVRISCMHTQHFFGMLMRLPLLLWRNLRAI